ncbi:type II toxin-antitoxin system RelE family toxin [Arthrobacter crystallopoietes]|uniref:mRNA interferase RelE/StbE n=1 Tax=Crystallibacter crystallopoietes TaxID=37928 RepID=A0A1H1AHI6_9MICC|nr:type II toxin-antitoxin system RelE/ParE family toxin [Arthrobacter crystallopoietes]AUI51528.1 plasmid stabilization protein [Arthrobacter crystallopoietes]SDQ39122.1 mRNA interferase RelE/StbE [Arthrobacter crystallopoietes]
MTRTYQVTLTHAAERSLRKLDAKARIRVAAAIELLQHNPRPPAAKRLVGGSGAYRICTGDYRIIYEITDGALVILVLGVGHRREIYR